MRKHLKRFPPKWLPVRRKETRQIKNQEQRSDFKKSDRALGPLLIAVALSSAPAFAQPTFVGIWYSGNQPDEPGVLSLIEFREDGTFREEFRKCENGNVVGLQTESGTWTLEGSTERLKVDRLNDDAAQIESTYTVMMLTDTERRVRMEPDGLEFVSHRVSKFEFPDCPSGV